MLGNTLPAMAEPFQDLAPMIYRQRLIIEGRPAMPIDDAAMRSYLTGLSMVCDMNLLAGPVADHSEQFGWAGWIHWETSGAHMYVWDRPILFFSVDIYTCKAFAGERAVEYTARYFDAEQISSREV